jgi:hypothetical protein
MEKKKAQSSAIAPVTKSSPTFPDRGRGERDAAGEPMFDPPRFGFEREEMTLGQTEHPERRAKHRIRLPAPVPYATNDECRFFP